MAKSIRVATNRTTISKARNAGGNLANSNAAAILMTDLQVMQDCSPLGRYYRSAR
jgi:hypothetical protein